MFGLVASPPRASAPLERALADLATAVTEVRRAAASGSAPSAICATLRAADLLTATATSLLGRGGFRAGIGMDPVAMLQLDAGRTYTDARMLVSVGGALATMPLTAAAFDSGALSYAVVRGVVCAVRPVDTAGRAAIDGLVGALAGSALPDDLLVRVDDEVAALRGDLDRAREDRAFSRGFLAIQGRLDGSGSFYGEGDALSIASLVEAVDAAADLPVNADDPDAPSRAQQRFDALIGICEDSLSGSATGTRPRARFIATLDLDRMAAGDTGAARLLWSLAGPAPRISALGVDMLLCDADIVPVLFREGRPVGVGDAKGNVPDKLRRALFARDGRCRFPTCRKPVGWADVHHVISPKRGGATDPQNCLLLCRTCHRTVHRYGWKITIREGGVIGFRYRGRSFESQPHKRMRA